jgi:hypothetical protein
MENQKIGSVLPAIRQPQPGRRTDGGGLRVGICESSFLTCELCNIKISGTKVKLCKSCGYAVYMLDSCDECLLKLWKPEKDSDLCYSCAQD